MQLILLTSAQQKTLFERTNFEQLLTDDCAHEECEDDCVSYMQVKSGLLTWNFAARKLAYFIQVAVTQA